MGSWRRSTSARSRPTSAGRIEGTTDQLRLVTDQGTKLHALVANESATQESFHEGERVYCSLHLDDLVIVQAE